MAYSSGRFCLSTAYITYMMSVYYCMLHQSSIWIHPVYKCHRLGTVRDFATRTQAPSCHKSVSAVCIFIRPRVCSICCACIHLLVAGPLYFIYFLRLWCSLVVDSAYVRLILRTYMMSVYYCMLHQSSIWIHPVYEAIA